MISMNDVNKQRIEDLFDGDILRAYAFVVNNGDMHISLSQKQSQKFLVFSLSKIGYKPKQISNMIGVSSYLSKKKCFNFPKNFLNAIKLLKNYITLVDKSEEYTAIPINLNKKTIETIIIERLFNIGWSNNKIFRTTGFSLRKIQRTTKKIRNSDD